MRIVPIQLKPAFPHNRSKVHGACPTVCQRTLKFGDPWPKVNDTHQQPDVAEGQQSSWAADRRLSFFPIGISISLRQDQGVEGKEASRRTGSQEGHEPD